LTPSLEELDEEDELEESSCCETSTSSSFSFDRLAYPLLIYMLLCDVEIQFLFSSGIEAESYFAWLPFLDVTLGSLDLPGSS